jgi:hypothetical protein
VPTLWLSLRRPVSGSEGVLRNTLFTVMDVNLVMMTTAELAADFVSPFDLLGGYVFLVAVLCGPIVGGACALSGFIGFFNGWWLPADLRLRDLLAGCGTAVAAAVAGVAWCRGLPLLVRAVTLPVANKSESLVVKLSEMEDRMTILGAERDRAQEQAHVLEAERDQAVEQARRMEEERAQDRLVKDAANVVHVDISDLKKLDGTTLGGDRDEKIHQLEEELMYFRTEQKKHLNEKRELMAEMSLMSKDLMAAYARTKTVEPPKELEPVTPGLPDAGDLKGKAV